VAHGDLLTHLQGKPELLRAVELQGPGGQTDSRKAKKLQEVAGFCEVILRWVRQFLARQNPLRIVEFSCGKSYLGIVLAVLLEELDGKQVVWVGVDVTAELIDKCRRLAGELGLATAEFCVARTLDYQSERRFDLAVALHACDTATDEAIARGIGLGVPMILAVPCCQNQIRGQIKSGHPLTAMTEFGPVRYRLADILTDALRAQFLRSAGYYVEIAEIASPRLTPKNLCICARKAKRRRAAPRDEGYRALKALFDVQPKLEQFCPGVIRQQ
jgi:hypothetical protein